MWGVENSLIGCVIKFLLGVLFLIAASPRHLIHTGRFLTVCLHIVAGIIVFNWSVAPSGVVDSGCEDALGDILIDVQCLV